MGLSGQFVIVFSLETKTTALKVLTTLSNSASQTCPAEQAVDILLTDSHLTFHHANQLCPYNTEMTMRTKQSQYVGQSASPRI